MPLNYTEKNDPSGFLAIHRLKINWVLQQVPMDVKKKIVRILKNTISDTWYVIDELDNIEHELFTEQYQERCDNYPTWYLFFRDKIVRMIYNQIHMDDDHDLYNEVQASERCLLKHCNEEAMERRELQEKEIVDILTELNDPPEVISENERRDNYNW